jgi:hypothetical protein
MNSAASLSRLPSSTCKVLVAEDEVVVRLMLADEAIERNGRRQWSGAADASLAQFYGIAFTARCNLHDAPGHQLDGGVSAVYEAQFCTLVLFEIELIAVEH